MRILFNHLYPALKARIEKCVDKFDFGELRFLTKELQRCVKQFWNFGTLGEIFLSVEDAQSLVKLIGDVAKEVREDREVRLEQFKTAKKKMDEEDIEYFEEDVRKVDKIENRKLYRELNFLDVMEISGTLAYVYKQNVS
jgi:biopolymer transport protein ExbB/TolQ